MEGCFYTLAIAKVKSIHVSGDSELRPETGLLNLVLVVRWLHLRDSLKVENTVLVLPESGLYSEVILILRLSQT